MYHGECEIVDLPATLEIAHRWGLDKFVDVIQKDVFARGILMCDNSAGRIWATADMLDLTDLRFCCIQYCARRMMECEKTGEIPLDLLRGLSSDRMSLLLDRDDVNGNIIPMARLAVAYVDAGADNLHDKDKDAVLSKVPWASIVNLGDDGIVFLAKEVLNNPRLCPIGQVPGIINQQLIGLLFMKVASSATTQMLVQKEFNVAMTPTKSANYQSLKVGMKVIVEEDMEELKRLCLRPAPEAKHAAGWTGSAEPLCGKTLEVSGIEPSVRGVKVCVGYGVWYLPFDSVRVVA
jgi:hypothetical protein